MKPHSPAAIAALVALLAGAYPGRALALERSCPGLSVAPDAGMRARWPELLERIDREFSMRADVDACARVQLRLEGNSVITVSVALPDGRATSRSVTRQDDVVPVLQALLLVPDSPRVVEPNAVPPTPSAPRRARLERTGPTDRDTAPGVTPARQLGFELSLLTGARAGDGQVGLGVGALSFLEVKSWLLGFAGRVDSYSPMAGGDPETALELALLGGKRFDFGRVALDLCAGPGVAMKGLAFANTEMARVDDMAAPPSRPPEPPPEGADPSSGPVPRLLLGARLGFSPRSIFRTFVGIDGAIGPTRASTSEFTESARLPSFSIGLALGATVGTP
jgi:hypothetical protein